MKRPNPFVAAALLSALLAASCISPTEEVVSSQRSPNWQQAPSEALTSAKEIPTPEIYARTHIAAGNLFQSQQLYAKAIAQYQKAIAVDPACAEAYTRLGILLGGMGRHTASEIYLVKAVELLPRSAPLRNNLGFEYAMQERWTDAESELRNAVQLDPNYDRAYVNLGMVLCKQGRYQEGLEAFQEAVPEADAYYNLGLMLRAARRYSDAADAFTRVLGINPGSTAAMTQLEQITEMIPTAPAPAELDELVDEVGIFATTFQPADDVAPTDEAAVPDGPVVESPQPDGAREDPAVVADQDEGHTETDVSAAAQAGPPASAISVTPDAEADMDALSALIEAALSRMKRFSAAPVPAPSTMPVEGPDEPEIDGEPDDAAAADQPAVQLARRAPESVDPAREEGPDGECADARRLPSVFVEPSVHVSVGDRPLDSVFEGAWPFVGTDVMTDGAAPEPDAEADDLDSANQEVLNENWLIMNWLFDESFAPLMVPADEQGNALRQNREAATFTPQLRFDRNWYVRRPGSVSLQQDVFDQVEQFNPVIWEFSEDEPR
ncbi:MAG: tetratricopeptide repeat protein [Phycisphaerales bacterium]|nr:MAG: tetratricopeptide repeat protein [Phycisphaerales bacterium]